MAEVNLSVENPVNPDHGLVVQGIEKGLMPIFRDQTLGVEINVIPGVMPDQTRIEITQVL